ncbi:MAG: Gfo/Idh/MocA family oxidoreductase [Actinocatenispora sp.]
MSRQIGVGIVGANPDRSWAARAHVPALHAAPDFTLAAVATTREETARAAQERFGAAHAFTDAASLAQHPDVDLVVVTVKVTAHVELVTAALEAGKNVYCEWPLTRTAAEAADLGDAAEKAGVHATVGLQARYDPAVARARDIIAQGELGTVLSATLYSARGKGNSHAVPAWTAYTYDATTGAGLVQILGGHALDLVQYLLGPITDITARTAVRERHHSVAETGAPIAVTAADQFAAVTTLDDGALMTIHLHDVESAQPRTRLEVAGTAGNLALVSGPDTDPLATQLQIGPLELHRSSPDRPTWRPVQLDDARPALPTQARNVAGLYRHLAADLRDGTQNVPSFRTAQALHSLIEYAQRDHA